MNRIKILLLLCLTLNMSAFSQSDVDVFMIARNTGIKVLANGDTIRVFGFAEGLMDQPGVPGPTIYANEGDSVHMDIWNVSQGAPHTIHLHGLDVDQYNDGVPHLSWDIPHMEHGFYNFKAPHAGTYLYHCHVASTIHVQAGMYGLIVIRPPDGSNTTWENGYEFDKEFSYFMSEIDTNWHTDSLLEHEHDTSIAIHILEIPKFEPQFFLINGFSDGQLIDTNEVFNSKLEAVNYIRLTNIGYCGVRVILPSELNGILIDSDGRPLPATQETDSIIVLPGERYGVLSEAMTEFTGEIQFEYFDLNTNIIKNTQVVPVTISGVYAIEDVPREVVAFDIAPNPFGEWTNVTVQMSKEVMASIIIMDMQGRLIKSYSDINFTAGENKFQLGSEMSASGIYLVNLVINNDIAGTKKIVKE